MRTAIAVFSPDRLRRPPTLEVASSRRSCFFRASPGGATSLIPLTAAAPVPGAPEPLRRQGVPWACACPNPHRDFRGQMCPLRPIL